MNTNQSYEVEIKVLLQEKENADILLQKIQDADPNLKLIDENNQKNHYFLLGDFVKLEEKLKNYLSDEQVKLMQYIVKDGRKHSVRTRWADGKVFFIIKASVDETTSDNGTGRAEFDVELQGISLDDLDQILLDSGFSYQAKWSRDRKEYKYKDYNVCLDRNAGYGYLAEFEKIIYDQNEVETAKKEIRDELTLLGIEELDQARLERMFAYYNENWPDYYGTEKVFNIE